MSENEATIVKLMTPAERAAQDVEAWAQLRHDQAVKQLEEMLEMAKANRIESLAISFVLENGDYGRIVPKQQLGYNDATLIGAVATTQHDLILRTLHPPE